MPIGTFFKNLLSRSVGRQELVHPDEEAIHHEALKLLPLGARRTVRYPPFMEGFPAYLTSDYLLGLQGELYIKLLGGVGLPKSQFDELVRPVILNYSRFVHLLPASENHHHCGPGGLLRHGLEVACFTMNGAKNTAFDSRKHPSERSHRAMRWNVAGLLCGLLHDTGKAVTDMQVVYPPTNLKWVHSEGTVEEWAKSHDLRKYYIEWTKGRAARHVMKSRDLVMTLCPAKTLTWLMDGGEDIVDALMDAIIGKEDSPLYRPLMMADGKSTKLDIASGDSPQYMTGLPIVKLITGAINRLTHEGEWTVNQPRARVWTTTEGVFIAWASGAQEIIDLILKDNIEGIPRTPNSLLMRLIDQAVAERSPDGEMYWEVAPHCLQKSDKPIVLRCMKLSSADTLFAYEPLPAPVSVMIRKEGVLVDYPANTEAQASSERLATTTTEAEAKPQPTDTTTSAADSAEQESEALKPATKGKKKAQPANTSDKPVLLEHETSESDKPAPARASDPVLENLADIDSSDDSEEGRQQFLESTFLAMSGVSAESLSAQHEEKPSQPTANEKKKFSLNSGARKDSAKSDSSASATLQSSLDNIGTTSSAHSEAASSEVPARTSIQGKQTSLNAILDRPGKGNAQKKPKSEVLTKAKPGHTDQVPGIDMKPAQTPLAAQSDTLQVESCSAEKSEPVTTQEENLALNAYPELAKHLLAMLERPDTFYSYLRRVFVPLKSEHPAGLDDAIAEQFIANQWAWQDFTDSSDSPIYTSNKLKGVVLETWLGNIITRNIERNLSVATITSVGEEKAEMLYPLVAPIIAAATPDTLPSGLSVLTLTLHKIKQVTALHDASHEEGLAALHLYRDTVYSWRRKIAYILPLEGEIKRLEQYG